MPDVFDQLDTEAPKKDIFDEVESGVAQPERPLERNRFKDAIVDAARAFTTGDLSGQARFQAALPEKTVSAVDALKSDAGRALTAVLNQTGLDPAAQEGQPLFKIPFSTRIPGTAISPLELLAGKEAAEGVEKKGSEILSGFTEPSNVATLPVLATRAGQALLAGESLTGLPDDISAVAQAKSPKETAAALLQSGVNAGMALAMGRGAMKGPHAIDQIVDPGGIQSERAGDDAGRTPAGSGVSSGLPAETPEPAPKAPGEAKANVTQTTPPVPPEEMPKGETQTGLRPAVRVVGGEVVPGDAGETHADIIKANDLKATDIDQRGFVGPEGQFLDREQGKAELDKQGVPTTTEEGRAHSTDLPEAKEEVPAPSDAPPEQIAPTADPKLEAIQEKVDRNEKLTKAEKKYRDKALAKSQEPEKPSVESGQGIIGMGGATYGEIQQTGHGADIHGIAQRIRDERANAGQAIPIEPGEGIDPLGAIIQGREILSRDPLSADKAVAKFNADKSISYEGMTATRAKGEEAFSKARKIEQQSGTDSDEYRTAFSEAVKWDLASKEMQTVWHKSGQAQQGQVDLDTGTFTGLQREFQRDTGNDFTPNQAKGAKKVAKDVADAEVDSKKAKETLGTELEKESKSPTSDMNDYQKSVWKKVREYLDKGEDDFDDMRSKVAADLGMSVDKVARIMTHKKSLKRASDEVFLKQQKERRAKEDARRWLLGQSDPAYLKILGAIPRTLFGLKVWGHGFVALGTHAPAVAYQPPFWSTYAKNYARMARMVTSKAFYERQMQDLVRRKNYALATRSGLVNDPFVFEDYSDPKLVKFFTGGGAGNRGYSVLKILRQDMFDKMWDHLPDDAKIPEVAQAISVGVNHATGITKARVPKALNVAFFAPRLEGSRIAWLFVDPAKSLITFTKWKDATPAEKVFAVNQAKEKAWVLGTLGAMLAANQGMLSASGSKQKINLDNPMQSDYLKFKAGGMDVSYGNAMLNLGRFPWRLKQIRTSEGGKLKHVIYPDESMYTATGEMARSQLSPFGGIMADQITGLDYSRRPLPSSNRPVPYRLAKEGVKPYTWGEYASQTLAPIPFQEALKEVYKTGFGMTDKQVDQYMRAFFTIGFQGFTGGRITEDYTLKKK